MSILDNVAHGLISVLATFARVMLEGLDFIEGGLRALMSGAGLGNEMQTLLLIFMLALFLLGVLRLLKGRLRMTLALLLILILAHTLEHIAHAVS
jgi:hypothetical protein